jgi:hypothetical protein
MSHLHGSMIRVALRDDTLLLPSLGPGAGSMVWVLLAGSRLCFPGCSTLLPAVAFVWRHAVQGSRLTMYRRFALGIVCSSSRKDDFAASFAAFSCKSTNRRVNESMGLVSSAMLKSLQKSLAIVVPKEKESVSIRTHLMEFQLWYLMAADMRDEFPLLRSAFKEYVHGTALSGPRFTGLEWTKGRPVVLDLLENGGGRKATLIHPEEVSRVYKVLCLAQHVPDRCHVSQTNIEAVINAITTRRSQAEWFLLVVIMGEVSSLSLASLVMAFTGSSGRLLLVYSTAVMEGLRVANRLADVHLTPSVITAEEHHVQWNLIAGFGSPAAQKLTDAVSERWRELVQLEEEDGTTPKPAWRQQLEELAESQWIRKIR